MKQLWSGGPVYTDDPAFKITTDSVLLANFAGGVDFTRCMDMGCGGGLLSVLLHHARPEAVFDSVDVRQAAVDVCRENCRANRIRGQASCVDLRQHRSLGQPGAYDLVVCNPPYYYSGKPSPDGDRAAARSGLSPAQFSGAASYLLRKGGTFCLVHKPEYLTDIFAAMRLADIEPKRLQMVAHKVESAPSLVLIAGRRGGRPGLAALPTLVLCNADGTPSQEIRRIYHMQSKTQA
ncbi:MAG: methyltransferase [Oscillospiraceae bacterium]|nr:methyltransferase [Oscillospiraceae bacterium]